MTVFGWICRFYCGHALEMSLVGRSAPSLRGIGVQGPRTVCATLRSVSYQPQNRLQMEGTFSGWRRSQSARSLASPQTSASCHTPSLDCPPSPVAATAAVLGRQENVCLPSGAVSAPGRTGGTHDQPIPSTIATVAAPVPPSTQRANGRPGTISPGIRIKLKSDGTLHRSDMIGPCERPISFSLLPSLGLLLPASPSVRFPDLRGNTS